MSTTDEASSVPTNQPTVLIDVADGVGVITLNRPGARNALNRQLRAELSAALASLDRNDDVAAIILTGSDPAFCAGLDLREVATEGLTDGVSEPPLSGVSKPVIGAINGHAVTGGLEVALGCDFLVASERALFADTHARVGVMPGWGLTVWLPEAIGVRRARQMSFTGNYIDAATALAWGLVNIVVPHDRLLVEAKALAADMTTIPHANLQGIKRAYLTSAAPTTDAALAAERSYSSSFRFDRDALAKSREAIQARGRQSGNLRD